MSAAAPEGVVVAWGSNEFNETDVPIGLSGVTAIAAGCSHSLALKSDGSVVAWPLRARGTNVPIGLSGVAAITTGCTHSLALKSDGSVVAWGQDANDNPAVVPAGLTDVAAIAAGMYFSLALKSDGTVVAWGENTYGQSTVPTGLTGVSAIAAGWHHSLALKSDGTVVAWGDNTHRERTVPTGLSGVAAIAAGDGFSLALKSDGTVVAWGENTYGQSTVPAGLSSVIAIAAGRHHTLALRSDGTVVTWGPGPTSVPEGLSGVIAIAGGENFSIALVAEASAKLVVSGMTTPRIADSTGSIRVTAVDADGKRVYDYRGTVHFTSSDPAASLPPDYTFTAADNGTHVFVANVILRTYGDQWVRATDTESSLVTGVQKVVTVMPHPVADLVVSGMTTPRLADSTGSIRVTAVDAVGKRVYGYRGTVHFTSSDAAASLPPDYTFTAADNGTHVFVANVILETLGTWSVIATDTRSPSWTGTQDGIVVNAMPLSLSGLTTPLTAGVPGSIRVTAVDTSGTRIHGYRGTIHFSSSDPLADLPADYTFTAADNGTHLFDASVILRSAGRWSVTAVDTATPSIRGWQSGISVESAALSGLRVSGMTTPRTAGSTGSIRVTAIDPYGNRVWGYRGTVHFTSSDAAASLPPDYTFTASDNGTRVFFANVILKTLGTWSVTATDTLTPSITGTQEGVVVR